MKNLLIWGLGRDFQGLLKYLIQEESGELCLTGVDLCKKDVSLIPVKEKNCIAPKAYDYLAIASSAYFYEIFDEAVSIGFKASSIIDARIFSASNFDFKKFEEQG